jgi:hypothetical protein
MARYRFCLNCILSMVVALILVQIGRSQEVTATPKTASCKVYSLAELGDDPKLCKWIAETIPEMIQPASWKQGDAKLSYYAPSKILVINNTAAVHAQVDEFLQSMRKTLPQKAAAKIDSQVMPAQFALQDSSRPVGSVQTGPASYPVPMSPVGPKHLFHFIIRYEGEGIIDANVAKFTQALTKEKAESISASYVFPPQPLQAPIGGPPVPQAGGANAPTTQAPPMPPADAPAADRAPGKVPPPSAPPTLPSVAQ